MFISLCVYMCLYVRLYVSSASKYDIYKHLYIMLEYISTSNLLNYLPINTHRYTHSTSTCSYAGCLLLNSSSQAKKKPEM